MKGRTIRLPDGVAGPLGQLAAATYELQKDVDGLPTDAALAEATGLSVMHIEALRDTVPEVVSIHQPIGETGQSELGDIIQDDLSRPDEIALETLSKAELYAFVDATLSERERDIVFMYWGMNGWSKMTYVAIGNEIGVSGERVKQLCNKALTTLRANATKLSDD